MWDLRQLQGLPDDDLTDDLLDDCILATTEQSNAVSSAYFDPSGTKILSTSYDDKLRGETRPCSLEEHSCLRPWTRSFLQFST